MKQAGVRPASFVKKTALWQLDGARRGLEELLGEIGDGQTDQNAHHPFDTFRAMCPEQQATFKTVGTALAQPISKKPDAA